MATDCSCCEYTKSGTSLDEENKLAFCLLSFDGLTEQRVYGYK